MEHNKHYNDRIVRLKEELSQEELNVLISEFESQIIPTKPSIVIKRFREHGLNNVTVKVEFDDYLAKKLLTPEDYDLLAYTKAKGYELVQQPDKKYKIVSRNK
ncbi:MAG: hypothetical protein HQK60_12775 [Deltaproteobacteria bacterium]|nr:hypothetical protein [Deltaproteobacteria bacterium]